MAKLEHFLKNYPIAGVFACLIFSVGLLRLAPFLIDESLADPRIVRTVIRYSVSAILIALMLKLSWARDAGITTPYDGWHHRWWLATIPMALIAVINLLANDWGAAEFTLGSTTLWVVENLGTGIFEETMLRGVCFFILYQAWQSKPHAFMKAALGQGLIFGLLHLLNLVYNPVGETLMQVIYATLLGIGFAGLVVFTRSIWPAVIVHAVINLLGSAEDLMPEVAVSAADDAMNLSGYLVAFAIIGLLSTAPGVWFLRKADKLRVQAAE